MDIANFGEDLSIFSGSRVDSLIEDFKRATKENRKMNPNKIFNVLYCGEILSANTTGKNVRIRTEFGTVNRNMASITILGKSVGFADTNMFCEVAKRSMNFEAYAKTNNEVEIVFTFRRMINE